VGRANTSGREEVLGKRGKMVNTVQNTVKKCVHMWVNEKMILLKLLQEPGESGMKENGWEDEFMYDIFDTFCNNLCKCLNVPPTSTKTKEKIK
jgi:hypothetical protein